MHGFEDVSWIVLALEAFSKGIVAQEQVDGEPVCDKFVDLGPPGEVFVQCRDDAEDGHAGKQWAKRLSVRDVQLESVAQAMGMFLKHGFEAEGAEEYPGKVYELDGFVCGADIEPWCAKDFEWPGGAASFRKIGAFQQAHAWVENGRLECRHVGRWENPAQIQGIEIGMPVVVLHSDDFEV